MSADFAIRPYEVLDGGRLSNAQKNEARLFALQIVRDPEFRERLLIQARKGSLPAPLVAMLFHYAYGKPPDRIEVGRGPDLADLSEEDLMGRLEAVKASLRGSNPTLEVEGAAAIEKPVQDVLTQKVLSLSKRQ